MPLKTSQSKEINLQQLPMMSENTLLTTSIVIMVLLNGKMIAHKIEFKIRVIILNKGILMLSGGHGFPQFGTCGGLPFHFL